MKTSQEDACAMPIVEGNHMLRLITYHKEGIRWFNVLAPIVFLAFDPSVSSGTLGAQSRRNIFNLPEEKKENN